MLLSEDEARSRLQRLYRRLDSRRPEIDTFEAYADGEQPLLYTTPQWAEFHKDRYSGFSDNWCAPVANAPVERLRATGIRLADDVDGGMTKGLWNAFLRNGGDTQLPQAFYSAVVARRSFARVWGDDNDDPLVDFLHPSQAYVHTDPTGRRRLAAVHCWVDEDDKWEHGHLYTGGDDAALYKFKRLSSQRIVEQRTPAGVIVVESALKQTGDEGGWQAYQDDDDETWPVLNPMGKVPIVELANRPRLGRQPVSDISGTKAMQDAINLLWAYLFAAADHASLPARVIMGQAPPKIPVLDRDGQKVGEREVDIKELAAKRMLWLTGENAKIGSWQAAQLDVFTGVIEVAIAHVASQTRTPSHYLISKSDNVPASGYELAEAGLVSRVEEAQTHFTSDLRDLFELIALADPATEGLAPQLRTARVLWRDAAIRNEAQKTDALQKKKAMGYPLRWLLEQDGLDPAEVERVMAMVADEQSDPTLERALRDLNITGQGPTAGV